MKNRIILYIVDNVIPIFAYFDQKSICPPL